MQNLLVNLPKIQIIPNFYKELPETPGIYTYFKNNEVIYIGKAINLKRRVSSYFDLDLEPKTARMISEANYISFIQVDSELSALLLEARLIRQYMPHYNIAAKDDKHPLYIQITREEFPRVITVRKIDLNKGPSLAVFGPFPSSKSVYTVLSMLRRIFPYSDHKIGKRACLYSHIGLCNPCPNKIQMLSDKTQILNEIQRYRKNIRNIKAILEGGIDKVSKELEKEMYVAAKAENYELAAHYRNQISQLEYITRPQMPTDFYMENPNLYEDQRKKELSALKALLVNFKLKIVNCTRIECFDIAHLSGTNATASMVTFINGEASKERYRHFKIKQKKSQSDFDSMEEVAERRKKHFMDWGTPDLIIVDGSVGQINRFKKIITNVPIVGIAKHPDRLVIISDTPDKSEVIQKIKLEGVVLNLVSRMRDEAHRFARRYHHALISKSIKNAVST